MWENDRISEAKEHSRKSKAAAYANEQRKKSREKSRAECESESDKNFRFKRGRKNYLMEIVARILRYVITFGVTKQSNK